MCLMVTRQDLLSLDDALNDLAKLYQFRGLDDRLYGALTVSHSYCLRILYFQGPRTMGELAADLDVRVSTMTGVIDQLEERRLVERADHPDDRRSLRVKLTAKGRQMYRGAHDAFLSHLEPLIDGRSPAARRQILAFLTDVIRVIQGWRQNPRKVQRHGKKNPVRGRLRRPGRSGHLRAVHHR
jgi:MarR family 2-MHQ and catechol resistance regulon transcriptional repressor